MQDITDNIDLDALFDMLNIVDSPAVVEPGAETKASASQLKQDAHEESELSPLEPDYFIIDLPVDQS